MEADLVVEAFEVAKELAVSAGKIAYEGMHPDIEVETKASATDLVTAVDKAVEDFIMTSLRTKFPEHRLIGEESSEVGTGLSDEPTWMVDPIDGTTNFVHGFPFSAVSIGFAVNKVPVVGVVYNFNLKHLYAARKGGGATLNGQPIRVSKCKGAHGLLPDLGKALVFAELGSIRTEELFGKKMADIKKIASEPRPVVGMRMLGSAALNMCMVAQGGADAYCEFGVHCWDIAAGDVIVREAGGVTMYPTGEPLDVMRRGILCAATQELALALQSNVQNLESYFEAD